MERPYQAGNPKTLAADVAAGVVDPGNLVAVREIVTPTAQTAATGTRRVLRQRANYTVTTAGGDGTLGSPGSTTTVVHNGGADGTDTLRNIERLLFSDTVVPGAPVIGTARRQRTGHGDLDRSGRRHRRQLLGEGPGLPGRSPGGCPAHRGRRRDQPGRDRPDQRVDVHLPGLATNAEGNSPYSAPSNTVTPAHGDRAGCADHRTATAGNASATLSWPHRRQRRIRHHGLRGPGLRGNRPARTQAVTGNVGTVVVTGLTNGTATRSTWQR